MSNAVTGRSGIRRPSNASLDQQDSTSSAEAESSTENAARRRGAEKLAAQPRLPEQRNDIRSTSAPSSLFGKVHELLFDPKSTAKIAVALMLFELVLCPLIINFVPYTEIDWQAYMDQVGMVHNGTLNYGKIRGRTGPLVYPAGFVWFFYGLYFLTSGGVLVRVAQYAFGFFYLLNMAVVMELYRKTQLVSPIALMFLTFGAKRVHSIFLLRMFNDPIAMLLAYAAFWALLQDWPIAFCALYSLSVSVKMNTLLFAPAVLFILYYRYGEWKTIHGLLICAGIQLAVAVPFLSVSWWGYLWKAFEFQRKFLHKETVNYRFLPENIFLHWLFHVALLAGHVAVLYAAYELIWKPLVPLLRYGAKPIATETAENELQDGDENLSRKSRNPKTDYQTPEDDSAGQLKKSTDDSTEPPQSLNPADEDVSIQAFSTAVYRLGRDYMFPDNLHTIDAVEKRDKNRALLLILFSSNLIGIAFARTLHYQFYSWYFHQLPFLLWNTPYPFLVRLIIVGTVEFCYLAYPSTVYSSALLHVCHAAIVIGLFLRSMSIVGSKNIASASN